MILITNCLDKKIALRIAVCWLLAYCQVCDTELKSPLTDARTFDGSSSIMKSANNVNTSYALISKAVHDQHLLADSNTAKQIVPTGNKGRYSTRSFVLWSAYTHPAKQCL